LVLGLLLPMCFIDCCPIRCFHYFEHDFLIVLFRSNKLFTKAANVTVLSYAFPSLCVAPQFGFNPRFGASSTQRGAQEQEEHHLFLICKIN
jgi:hypothetical protein